MRKNVGRVLMLVENNSYPRDTRVRSEAEALRGAGYQVSVICPSAKGLVWHESVNGVHVYRFPQNSEAHGFLGYLWEYGFSTVAIFLLSLLVWARDGFDVIHAANPSDTLVFIAAFHKLFGKRFVFDHHDLSPEMYNANFGNRANRVVYHVLVWLEKFSCRLADHVIATNESYKQVEMERSGVPAERITIVRNGPDLRRFPAGDSDPALPSNRKAVIGYVGLMGPHDGIDCLLRALNHLVYSLRRTDFECVLVGGVSESMLNTLNALKTQLGLDDFVRFTGWVSEADKLRYLGSADICVDPDPSNPFNDRSTMIKIAEYMAMGKPVIGFDLPENRFTAQEAGLFVPANDDPAFAQALAALMDDPIRRQVMGAFGRRRVETELAWCYSVPKLISVYRSILPDALREPISAHTDRGQAAPLLAETRKGP